MFNGVNCQEVKNYVNICMLISLFVSKYEDKIFIKYLTVKIHKMIA